MRTDCLRPDNRHIRRIVATLIYQVTENWAHQILFSISRRGEQLNEVMYKHKFYR